jgi:hypothetical protein
MPELNFQVVTYGVDYICNVCGRGKMIPTGVNDWLTSIPKIQHECTQCGSIMDLPEKYPVIRHDRINV